MAEAEYSSESLNKSSNIVLNGNGWGDMKFGSNDDEVFKMYDESIVCGRFW